MLKDRPKQKEANTNVLKMLGRMDETVIDLIAFVKLNLCRHAN